MRQRCWRIRCGRCRYRQGDAAWAASSPSDGGSPAAAAPLGGHRGGWLGAAIALIALSLLVFTVGRYGLGVSFSVVDSWMLERLAGLRRPGLERVMVAVSALLGTIWTVKVLAWATLVVLVVSKRFRQLLVGAVSVQVVTLATMVPSAAVRRRCG